MKIGFLFILRLTGQVAAYSNFRPRGPDPAEAGDVHGGRGPLGGSTGDPLTDKVLEIIRKGPVTTKQIHDKTNRHHRATELGGALGRLRDLGLIRSEQVATGGRPAERWALT
jgi:hypothetical protein